MGGGVRMHERRHRRGQRSRLGGCTWNRTWLGAALVGRHAVQRGTSEGLWGPILEQGHLKTLQHMKDPG